MQSLSRLAAVALLFGATVFAISLAVDTPPPALATASCPNGTGYGGQVGTLASSAGTQAGHGCVVIEHTGNTVVFTYTGAVQQWTVPTGVTSIALHLVGAGGGGSLRDQGGSTGGTGGGGGYATGTLAVTPGDVYDIIVGQGGRHHCVAENIEGLELTQRRNFSFGGGASGYGLSAWDCSWASGGGRSAIRIAGGTDDIATAGGGGGGGYGGNGGAGGGSVGQSGDGGVGASTHGIGGNQTLTTNGGVGEDAYSGIQYAGGPAGLTLVGPSEGGGGGGGYFGGGGGGNNAGGGGGSSFVGAVRGLQAGTTTAGNRRLPGAVPPVNTALPSISGTACIGSLLTATSGSFTGATSQSFKWQSSPNGTSWTDISGATGSTHTISTSGYVRAVDVGSNLFGSTSANSSATAAIDDTTLSALVVTNASLSPTFDSDVFAYTASVTHSQSTVTITPTRSGSLSTITVVGVAVTSGSTSDPISLAVGSNSIEVVTTNGSCSTTTSLTITRQSAVTVAPEATTPSSTTTTTTSIPTIPAENDPNLESTTGSSELPDTGTDTFALIPNGFLMLITGAFLVLRRRSYI